MKTRLIIVEPCIFQATATRYMVEVLLKVPSELWTDEGADPGISTLVADFAADHVIERPGGSIFELFMLLKRRGYNRRNCEIAILSTENFRLVTNRLAQAA